MPATPAGAGGTAGVSSVALDPYRGDPQSPRPPAVSDRRETIDQLLRSKTFMVGLVIVIIWILCALFGTYLTQDPYATDAAPLTGLSSAHWFGTDKIGRDVFARVIAGSRDILIVAPLATLLGTVLGTMFGLIMGYFRGRTDDVLSRIIEAILALPLVITAVVAITALGQSQATVVITIGVVFAPIIARTVRTTVLAERELDYVQAAKLRGERSPYIMFVEILPNVMAPILVEFTVRLGYAIFTIAALSFLGYGLQPPSPDWGVQVFENYVVISYAWWTVLFPSIAIGSLVVSVNLIADGFTHVVDRVSDASNGSAALELRDLDVAYRVRGRWRQVLRSINLRVEPGESYGLVGESGCGKSTAALAAVRYLPRNGRVSSGSVLVAGSDVWRLGAGDLRRLRADSVSMVYQNPGAALNPSLKVGRQLAEVFWIHGITGADARRRSLEMLEKVQIADPQSVLGRYPHQLSGGMQQRVVIAMALASNPTLLILDEPTTGLDATVEAEVLDLIRGLRAETKTSVLFISHNLGVIASMCDRIGVLYAGELVEEGPSQQVLHDPRHPYTVGLLRCIPRAGARKDHGRLDTIPGFLPSIGADLPGCVFADRCGLAESICQTEPPPLHDLGDGRHSRCHFHERAQSLPRETPSEPEVRIEASRAGAPAVRVQGLAKTFRQSGHDVHALTDVTVDLWPGETLGLVGESGSGKTTFARTLLGIVEPTAGSVELEGRPVPGKLAARSRDDVRSLQIVFQNPDSALNRRHSVRRLLARTLKKLSNLTGKEAEARLLELTRSVRLADRYLSARPAQLSGGLKQRVAIARAFAGTPRVVVCDEPTSALDVSVQAAILNLLAELQTTQKVSYVFISHDLGVVRYLSDRIAVLYLGRLMELGPAHVVFDPPHHPYTEALLSAMPSLEGAPPSRIKLEGEIPSAATPPSGCVFHTRCPRRLGAICEETEPPLIEVEPGHAMRCHIPIEELRTMQRPDRPVETSA